MDKYWVKQIRAKAQIGLFIAQRKCIAVSIQKLRENGREHTRTTSRIKFLSKNSSNIQLPSKSFKWTAQSVYKTSFNTQLMYSLNVWIKNLCNSFNKWSNYLWKVGKLVSHKCPNLFKKVGGVFTKVGKCEWKHSQSENYLHGNFTSMPISGGDKKKG